MKTLAERIQHVLDETGISKAELARAAGLTDAAVTHWLNGDTRSIKGATAAQLETKVGFRAAWLASGKGPKLVAPSEKGDMLLPKEVQVIEALRHLTAEEQERFIAAVTEAARHNQAVVAQHIARLASDPNAPRKPPLVR
jgi:transcriptional regulator with XRE-family HTH domain